MASADRYLVQLCNHRVNSRGECCVLPHFLVPTLSLVLCVSLLTFCASRLEAAVGQNDFSKSVTMKHPGCLEYLNPSSDLLARDQQRFAAAQHLPISDF